MALRTQITGRPVPRLLRRLAQDTGGTTLAIVGAALIPMTAIIGSGVDISRAYMASSRLQTACDAGALAGRKAMTGDTLTDAVKTEARRFFDFNFEQRRYGTFAFTPAITRPRAGTVAIEAKTSIPTGIMHMFGFDALPVEAKCEATLNFVNTDVVLVLDVTGSMDSDLDGVKKMVSMREAVMAFYDELAPVQTQLEAAGMRLRYSIVPYSSTVNVGKLIYAKNSSYIANSWTYQSRMPVHYTFTQRTESNKTSAECDTYRRDKNPGGDVYPATQVVVSRPGTATRRDCIITTLNYNTDEVGQWSGYYLHVGMVHDVSQYKKGLEVDLPTRTPGSSTRSPVWAGCIEERETDNSLTSSNGYSIPATAYDLNIDAIPNNDDTRWKPLWPEVGYRRNAETDDTIQGYDDPSTTPNENYSDGFRAASACPAEAKRLVKFTRAEMKTYVDGLQPTGSTYHDAGMIWGARMISSAGVFGDSPDTFNGMPTNRHVVFMTDGELAPTKQVYGLYGQEQYDQRVTGTYAATGQYDRHEHRFRMMCNETKGKKVSIWSIIFVSAGDPAATSSALADCASSADQVAVISNRANLIAKFREIGKSVGALRLQQ